MLQIIPQMKIFLASKPIDFRKGIDGIVYICKKKLEKDPFSGAMFVFTNKNRKSIKILVYDGQGFWLCHKRFSKGRLNFWPTSENPDQSLTASQLQILLYNGNPANACIPADWRKIA